MTKQVRVGWALYCRWSKMHSFHHWTTQRTKPEVVREYEATNHSYKDDYRQGFIKIVAVYATKPEAE